MSAENHRLSHFRGSFHSLSQETVEEIHSICQVRYMEYFRQMREKPIATHCAKAELIFPDLKLEYCSFVPKNTLAVELSPNP